MSTFFSNARFVRLSRTLVAGAVSVFALGAVAAHAEVVIDVDLTSQTMHVASAEGSYAWPVSTARAGFTTPRGHFSPIGMERMHYSKKYHNSPMPYSIFFRGGYAIHGSYATAALGTPASHGCVRLSPAHAQRLYELVQREGASISITGAPRGAARYASR
jgi:lipoprotein-anchoring transpeptidase ErfK/SrfK